MLAIRSVLVPVDFSAQSEAAAEHAAALALHFDAKLLFAHVIERAPAEYRAFSPPSAREAEARQSEQLAKQLTAFAARHAVGCPTETEALTGDPAARLEQLARERGVDLVVMATRGHGGFRRLLIGSLTAKILHDLDCPVLTGAHLDAEAPFGAGRYTRIACAVGLLDKQHSAKVLRWAADFAASWNAELHLVHAPPAVEWAAGEWFPPDTRTLIKQAAEERAAELVKEVGCEAEIHVESADPIPHVLDTIQGAGCDLLIVGRSVEHGILHLRGGDALRLIREAPTPVMSV